MVVSCFDKDLCRISVLKPGVHARGAPGLLKLFSENCVCTGVYVCLFVFPCPREQTINW